MKPCSGCARHVRVAESVCPFCGAYLAEGTAPSACGWAVGLAMLGAACGTDKGDTDSASGATTEVPGSTGSTTADGATLTSAPTTAGTLDETGTGTSTGAASTTECASCSGASEGGAFIYAAPDMGLEIGCDPWVQDCPEGQKCAPTGSDELFLALECVPAASPGGAVGEACTVQDQPLSGLDDCAKGLICVEVDPETLIGVCAALCAGTPDAPSCEPGTTCQAAAGGLVSLCL